MYTNDQQETRGTTFKSSTKKRISPQSFLPKETKITGQFDITFNFIRSSTADRIENKRGYRPKT